MLRRSSPHLGLRGTPLRCPALLLPTPELGVLSWVTTMQELLGLPLHSGRKCAPISGPWFPSVLSNKELCDSREICASSVLSWLQFSCKFKTEAEACSPLVTISPLLVVQEIRTAIVPTNTVVVVTLFRLSMPAVYYLRVFFNIKTRIHRMSTLGQALFREKIKRHKNRKPLPPPPKAFILMSRTDSTEPPCNT